MSQANVLLDPSVTITLTDNCIIPVAAGAVTNAAGVGPSPFGQVTVGALAEILNANAVGISIA